MLSNCLGEALPMLLLLESVQTQRVKIVWGKGPQFERVQIVWGRGPQFERVQIVRGKWPAI